MSLVLLCLLECVERKKISRKFFCEFFLCFVFRMEFFFCIGVRGVIRKVSLGWEECRRGMFVVECVGEKSVVY